MATEKRKWMIFAGVFVAWLVADLWSKHWAETRLATPQHPLVARVAEGDVGKALKTFAAEKFDLGADEIERAFAHIERLEPAVRIDPSETIFASGRTRTSPRGYWVFWRDDINLPPRRLDRATELSRVEAWLALSQPATAQADHTETARKALAEETFAGWASQVFRKLDAEKLAAMSGGDRIHPIGWATINLPPEQPVAAGETYILTSRHIDVMGDWFKFLYAENPGAAFGFMKGIEPSLRHTLFMILSAVAFIVILAITRKLPPQSRLVLVSFAGILAGAVGNFVDRIRFNYVIDFIDMDLGFMQWPTYNIADIGISVGVIVLVIDLTFNRNSVLATPKKEPVPVARS
jgi:signal peptidase II